MLNTSAAQLVTLSLAGEPIVGDVVEISGVTMTDDGMTVDVVLADGRTFAGENAVDALDITAIPARMPAAAAA